MGSTEVLLVEDDAKVARSLRVGLMEHGYAVTLAASCAEAERLLSEYAYALIVLDLGLPDRDGIELLRDLRSKGSRAPVLVLTARDAVQDRVLGLEAGADDYLAKPFAFSELLARMRALSRRAGTGEPSILQVGDLTMNLLNRTAERGGRALALSPLEFDVLAYLAHKPGLTISRDTLMRDVWKITSRATSMDNVIDVLMTRLREKVDKGYDQRLLNTVRGVGYRLEAAG